MKQTYDKVRWFDSDKAQKWPSLVDPLEKGFTLALKGLDGKEPLEFEKLWRSHMGQFILETDEGFYSISDDLAIQIMIRCDFEIPDDLQGLVDELEG